MICVKFRSNITVCNLNKSFISFLIACWWLLICYLVCFCFCFLWCCSPTRAMASSFLRFLDHTRWHITVGRTPLDEWSARRRDFYLTTHNTHNRQASMPPVGFEPMISASEWPQTYALDCAATGTGYMLPYKHILYEKSLVMTDSNCWPCVSSLQHDFPLKNIQRISLLLSCTKNC